MRQLARARSGPVATHEGYADYAPGTDSTIGLVVRILRIYATARDL